MVGELHKFGQDINNLYANLKCTAALRPIEPYLLMTLNGDGRGYIHVVGMARHDPQSRTKLEFEFDMDQTELPPIASALLVADHA